MADSAKHDSGKNRLDLVFPSFIEEVGYIRTYGVQKYHDPDNWRNIEDAKQRYIAAAMRHFNAWRSGEKKGQRIWFAPFIALRLQLNVFNRTRKNGGI